MLLSQSGCERIEISQTYLISGDGVSARVRKSVCGGKCTYTRTEKTHITDMSRTETENEITEDEYRQALLSAAPGLRTVEKVRYRIPGGEHVWEIDVFPFWETQAYLEAELSSEEERLELPPFVELIREVTGDGRYTNRSLAKAIPPEDRLQ